MTTRAKVTASDIERIALEYDREYRGGVGRGDIDPELAERLANWFNTGVASPGPTEQETERIINDSARKPRCRSQFDGIRCDLPLGHTHAHIADLKDGRPKATWHKGNRKSRRRCSPLEGK